MGSDALEFFSLAADDFNQLSFAFMLGDFILDFLLADSVKEFDSEVLMVVGYDL